MNIGEYIKEKRLQKGMTQEELAAKTDISIRTIQRIENGEVDPRSYTLQMIAKELDIDFSIFMENVTNEDNEVLQVNNNNWLALLHLSGIFYLILPTIFIWNRKKGKIKDITAHYRDIIYFQLICWLGIIIPGLFIYWKINQPIPLIFGIMGGGILSIVNAIKVMNGNTYNYGRMNFFKNKKG
jgi:transcriptional regulator with XRE-family HTH domain